MRRRNAKDPTTAAAIGARLKIARQALGYTQATMAKLMGSATAGQAWENYEAGRRRISMDHALALCVLGLSLDWIYRGVMDGLSTELRQRIEEHTPR